MRFCEGKNRNAAVPSMYFCCSPPKEKNHRPVIVFSTLVCGWKSAATGMHFSDLKRHQVCVLPFEACASLLNLIFFKYYIYFLLHVLLLHYACPINIISIVSIDIENQKGVESHIFSLNFTSVERLRNKELKN